MTKTYAEYVEETKKRKPSIYLAPPSAMPPVSARPKKQRFEQPPLDVNYWRPKKSQ